MMKEIPDERKVILLIEDEADLVDVYAESLEGAGYRVIVAYDGETGLKMAAEEVWDLLLLDIMLPEKDGMAVLENLLGSGSKIEKRGPVVLLTNLNSEDLIERSYSLGADDYLIKAEVSLTDLINKVTQYLG